MNKKSLRGFLQRCPESRDLFCLAVDSPALSLSAVASGKTFDSSGLMPYRHEKNPARLAPQLQTRDLIENREILDSNFKRG
jgi:hypothetical protein